jgi:hypothetical protein
MGLTISTPEPFGVGLALAGVAAADRGRHGRAVLLLVASALVRESGAVVALAVAVGLLLARPRPRWPTLAGYLLPAVALTAWSEVLAATVGGPQSVLSRIVPLGLLHATPPSIALGIAALGLAGVGTWHWRDVPVAWPVTAAFGCWMLTYSSDTSDWLALPRAAAPALVLGLCALGAVAGAALLPLRRRVPAVLDAHPG